MWNTRRHFSSVQNTECEYISRYCYMHAFIKVVCTVHIHVISLLTITCKDIESQYLYHSKWPDLIQHDNKYDPIFLIYVVLSCVQLSNLQDPSAFKVLCTCTCTCSSQLASAAADTWTYMNRQAQQVWGAKCVKNAYKCCICISPSDI